MAEKASDGSAGASAAAAPQTDAVEYDMIRLIEGLSPEMICEVMKKLNTDRIMRLRSLSPFLTDIVDANFYHIGLRCQKCSAKVVPQKKMVIVGVYPGMSLIMCLEHISNWAEDIAVHSKSIVTLNSKISPNANLATLTPNNIEGEFHEASVPVCVDVSLIAATRNRHVVFTKSGLCTLYRYEECIVCNQVFGFKDLDVFRRQVPFPKEEWGKEANLVFERTGMQCYRCAMICHFCGVKNCKKTFTVKTTASNGFCKFTDDVPVCTACFETHRSSIHMPEEDVYKFS